MARHGRKSKTAGLRGRAWWALRKNKHMTLVDIQFSVCTGQEKNAETNLRGWLNKLVTAGILSREKINDGKLTSNGSYCYSLINDLGPQAPVVRAKYAQVYDPNSGNIFNLHRAKQADSPNLARSVNGGSQ